MSELGVRAWSLLVPPGSGMVAEIWDRLVSVHLELLSDVELREHGRLDVVVLDKLPQGCLVKALSEPFQAGWQAFCVSMGIQLSLP